MTEPLSRRDLAIRPAADMDRDALLSMGRHFHAEYDPAVPFVSGDFLESVAVFRDRGAVLTDGIGCMAALYATPLIYNRNILVAHEQWMWIEPGARSRDRFAGLLAAMEIWCRDAGVRRLYLGAVPWMRSETVARLYRRYGYTPSYHLFEKVL